MSRRYGILVALVLVAAVAVSAIARLPRAPRPAPAPEAPLPVTALAITVGDDRVEPETASVPKGHRVALRITSTARRVVRLRLAGYDTHVAVDSLAPGATVRVEFVADLPGEDFAWIVNGEPRGRLRVAGSHLVEGHR